MRTILFAITLLFLCSCSNVPKSASYRVTTQQKMQAAHHWDVLAKDVAKEVKVKLALASQKDPALLGKRIYLEPNKESLFGEVFNTLLKTQLFKQEIKLSKKNEKNSLKLTYETQIVEHCSNRNTSPLYPGMILSGTALGHGVYKAFSANSDALGLFAVAGTAEIINDLEHDWWTVPHHEIVITTDLTNTDTVTNDDNDTVIARTSNIYYINDADFWHYSESEEKELPIKNYTCVSE